MKRLVILLCLLFTTLIVSAQTQPFGKVDTSDLRMTSCDFEKGASAMILFDKSDVETGLTSTTILRHIRIKILTDAGKNEATIKLVYISYHGASNITEIQAQTINLTNSTIQYFPLEKTAFYHEKVDRGIKRVSFTFPQVKPGSIIEYSYKMVLGFDGDFPDWNFQGPLPVRYCEFNASIRNDFGYIMTARVYQPYAQNKSDNWMHRNDTIGKKYTWAFKNVHAFSEEPFSTCKEDDIQKLAFRLSAYKYRYGDNLRSLEKTWLQVSKSLTSDEDFYGQLDQALAENEVIKKAKLLHNINEKINYIFDEIKGHIKWDGHDRWYSIDGIKKTWDKKQGNSAEINLLLCYCLNKAGVKCYPEVVSTRDNGRINTTYASLSQFNKTVVYVPLPDKKYYILDASDKYNNYQDIPFDILNSYGLMVNRDSSIYTLLFMKNEKPSRKIIFIDANITPDGKMTGNTQLSDFSYYKSVDIALYKTDGEDKYKDNLRDDDNNLKILSLKLENMDVDSLPLTHNIDFKLDLTGSDDNYIYFNPNLFTGLHNNPFIGEERNSDINFKFLRSYSINGRYKMPEKYKTEALPKNVSMRMPDTSITFKRIVVEQEGYIMVRYQIYFKKSYFPKDEYASLRDFYRKMHELLNEQIILKKT